MQQKLYKVSHSLGTVKRSFCTCACKVHMCGGISPRGERKSPAHPSFPSLQRTACIPAMSGAAREKAREAAARERPGCRAARCALCFLASCHLPRRLTRSASSHISMSQVAPPARSEASSRRGSCLEGIVRRRRRSHSRLLRVLKV